LKPWLINKSVKVIQSGGILAYPTEAVYGLGCSAYSLSAIKRILCLKQRNSAKGLILVGYDINQFEEMINFDSVFNKSEILATWPGHITWILPAKPRVPNWLTGKNKGLAVRISAHPIVKQLCKKAGILVSTSANPGGYQAVTNSSQVRAYFGNKLDYIYPGMAGQAAKPSEIRDALTGKVLRSGI
jgi:L-threonylcarbamoyladenylate synthase